MSGMFEIASRLFGITIRSAGNRLHLRPAARSDVETGRRTPSRSGIPEVSFYEIHDSKDRRAPRFVLRRLAPARVEARRRVDELAAHRRPGEPHLGPDRRQHEPAGRRQARAAHPPRGGDDLPRVRPPAARPAQRGARQIALRHQRAVGFRRAALPDHGELLLGPRVARPVRPPPRDRRADPGATCSTR
jgi:hypothetical protein